MRLFFAKTRSRSQGLHGRHQADVWAAHAALAGGHFGDGFTGCTTSAITWAISAHAIHAMRHVACFVHWHFFFNRLRLNPPFGSSGNLNFLRHCFITSYIGLLSSISVVATEQTAAGRKTESGHSAKRRQKKVFHDGR